VTVGALVGVAAAVGAVCRYLLDQLVTGSAERRLPWGTGVVNVSGSLLLGLLTGLALHHGLGASTATVLGVGLLGGYTTWSTYVWESLALGGEGDRPSAVVNVVGSLALGLAAAAAGLGLGLL
jgi:CrcB protein